MKKGWKYKKIGEVAKICGGKRLPKGCKLQSEPTNHKYIRVADFLDNGTICKDNIQYITDDIFNQIKRYTISSADVYISIAGTIGKSGIIPEELNGANLTENACKLVLNKELDKRFVYLVTTSPFFKEQINSLTKKSAQPKLALTRLATVNIPIPPLSEQKEIVEYLDSSFAKIDKLKANAVKNFEEAKALFQSALKDTLEPKEGWEEKTLKEIGITQTGTTPSKSDSANYGNYMEFIRPSEINFNGMGGINHNCELKLSEQGASKGRIFEEKSILMVCIGATIGKVGFSEKKLSCNQQINVLTPSSEYDYKFVYYSMKSPKFQKMVIKEGTSSQATLPIINKGKWEKLTFPVPSLQEQQSIVSFLDSLNEKVNTLQQNYSRICNECDALKQAILRQVFE